MRETDVEFAGHTSCFTFVFFGKLCLSQLMLICRMLQINYCLCVWSKVGILSHFVCQK